MTQSRRNAASGGLPARLERSTSLDQDLRKMGPSISCYHLCYSNLRRSISAPSESGSIRSTQRPGS